MITLTDYIDEKHARVMTLPPLCIDSKDISIYFPIENATAIIMKDTTYYCVFETPARIKELIKNDLK